MNSVDKFLQASKLKNLCVTGTKIGEQAFLISQLSSPIFFVVGDSETAYKAHQQLLALNKRSALIDSVDNPYIISKYQSQDSNINILNILYNMVNNTLDIVVITPQAINLKLGDASVFKQNILDFGVDKTINLQQLIANLIKCGYNRVETVQQVGEFAIRGEVIDIFAPNHAYPIRINLFDDLIENIIYFDHINLSTISKLEHIQICPMKDVILDESKTNECIKKLANIAETTKENKLYELLSNFEINKKISNEYLSVLGVDLCNIFSYMPKAKIVLSNPLHIKSQLEQICAEQSKMIDALFANDEIKAMLNPLSELNFSDDIIVFDSLGNFKSKNTLDLPTKNLSSYLYKTELIKFELASVRNRQIQLCLDNEYTFNSIKNLLTSNGVGTSTSLKDNGIVLTQNKLPYNVCFTDDKVWYIGSSNFAHKKAFNNAKNVKIKFLPKAGEYVVHDIHGIGRCEGVVTLNVMGADKDFFKIVYKNEDVLYVPTENTNSLSLYMCDGGQVNLNRLGGKEFAQNKARTQAAIEDMAKELLVLYSKRQNSKGHKYSEDNYLCTEFDNAFEHEETPDQAQAIQDIKNDMTSGKVMDRLICGDVGYGKTEVAMRAAFRAVIEGKQVAVLAPTTILSLQHYMTFSKRFKDFDVRIEMLNRFKSAKEKADIIKRLKDGKIDIICGTHSLVADGVGFKDLGLMILDEEQRFGVKAKEKLKSIKANVGVITMSATPIPRTLNMALLTIRDISIINTPPQNRLPVKTYVIPYEDNVIIQAINSEIERGGQVLVVYNDIDKIYTLASTLKQTLTPLASVDVAHGKMTKTALENAIKRLYDKQTNVFVSTTLIENGVD
ncbi:MAG: DEAD/DEAH box helicase, partial [Clostridia bacterium]|nr:DEAD/DEAH box helicase [Clostridia bacterium]